MLCVLITNTDLRSQKYSLELSSGLSTFQMETLKGLNQDLNAETSKRLSLNTQITDNFPSFLWYNLSIKTNYSNNYHFGGVIGLVSTGSRISYADYSGTYSLDNNVYGVNLGLAIDIVYPLNEEFDTQIGLESGVLVSNFTSSEKYVIDKISQDFNYLFSATSVYMNAKGKLTYKIKDYIKIGLVIGYMYDISSNYHLSSNSNAILTRPSNNMPVSTEWTGIRSGLLLIYNF